MRSLLNHPERWLTGKFNQISYVYRVTTFPIDEVEYTNFNKESHKMSGHILSGLEWLSVPGEEGKFYLSDATKERMLEVISHPDFCVFHFPDDQSSDLDEVYKPYPFVYVY